MKKVGIIALAALLVVAFTLPTWALESEFGGYWRTRFFTNQNFTGEDKTEAMDFQMVDTRTRLYYTAIFHENLKFVNKFEWDADWGKGPLGDIGADGKELEIKNSYADFNLGPVNAKVGIQGATVARGFIFSDDFSGAIISFNGPSFAIPLIWIRNYEGGVGLDANDGDFDYFGIAPSFNAGPATINPYAIYATSDNISASGYSPKFLKAVTSYEDNRTNIIKNDLNATFGTDYTYETESSFGGDDADIYYVGLDVDVNFGMGTFWLTGIYQGGSIDNASISMTDHILDGETVVPGYDWSYNANMGDVDISAWLAAVGGNVDFGLVDVHGQFFYATGQDADDEDITVFFGPDGQSYYWAEIMGYGDFDDIVSAQAPADAIGNVMAANLGVTIKPVDKLSISVDAWYAALAEDIVTMKGNEESYLGTEVDLTINYELVKGLNLKIIGAYLFAGEATTLEVDDEADPYEVGTQLSLSF